MAKLTIEDAANRKVTIKMKKRQTCCSGTKARIKKKKRRFDSNAWKKVEHQFKYSAATEECKQKYRDAMRGGIKLIGTPQFINDDLLVFSYVCALYCDENVSYFYRWRYRYLRITARYSTGHSLSQNFIRCSCLRSGQHKDYSVQEMVDKYLNDNCVYQSTTTTMPMTTATTTTMQTATEATTSIPMTTETTTTIPLTTATTTTIPMSTSTLNNMVQ